MIRAESFNNIILNLKNIYGKSISRRIVVFECDDWGGIRIPSKEVYNRLLDIGVPLTTSRYRFDTLESKEDLESLFDTLAGFTDRYGHKAVFTAITNVANPDFARIAESGFSNYYYEKFTDTLKRYYPGSDVFKIWKGGSDAGVFVPELHGREHITIQLWLNSLREGDDILLKAFQNGLVTVKTTGIPEPASEFRPEFFFTSEIQKPFLVNSIKDGISLFREIFGYTPRIFVPSNGIFHPDFDKLVEEAGVRFLYVSHRMPYPVDGGKLKYRYFLINRKGPGGIIYYTRNCAFEPTDENYKGIDLTMKQINAAFRWGKPAIISTHRVNFVGGIEPINRDKGLLELRKLLKEILLRWPDAEFMSSADALNLIYS